MFYDPNYDIEKDDQVQSQIESLHDELSSINGDVMSIGGTSFNTIQHDRSMTTLNPDRAERDLMNKTPGPGSRLSNRSKISNASRSAKGEGIASNILLDDYGMTEFEPNRVRLKQKYRTTNKKNRLRAKNRSIATIPIKDLNKEFDDPQKNEPDTVSVVESQGKRSQSKAVIFKSYTAAQSREDLAQESTNIEKKSQ